jgi:hypothetical protein
MEPPGDSFYTTKLAYSGTKHKHEIYTKGLVDDPDCYTTHNIGTSQRPIDKTKTSDPLLHYGSLDEKDIDKSGGSTSKNLIKLF